MGTDCEDYGRRNEQKGVANVRIGDPHEKHP